MNSATITSAGTTLVLGSNGRTGGRVAERLSARGVASVYLEPGNSAEYARRTAAGGVWGLKP